MDEIKLDIEVLQEQIQKVSLSDVTPNLISHVLSVMDLTSFDEGNTLEKIEILCGEAETAYGDVAAVCVAKRFVETSFRLLRNNRVQIATVINYPKGDWSLNKIEAEIIDSINAGAQEIDFIFPYQAFLKGHTKKSFDMLRVARNACGDHLLKVVLEVNYLDDVGLIYRAAHLAIQAGADFLVTSTTKIPVDVSLKMMGIMAMAIQHYEEQLAEQARKIGLKASGGFKTVHEAVKHILLCEEILGRDRSEKEYFRIGASTLLENILVRLASQEEEKQE